MNISVDENLIDDKSNFNLENLYLDSCEINNLDSIIQLAKLPILNLRITNNPI